MKVIPASILYKSIAGRYRPVSYPDGPITARYRFIKNAYWDVAELGFDLADPGSATDCAMEPCAMEMKMYVL